MDCPDPDHMTPHERRLGRIAHEEASSDPEHYLYVLHRAHKLANSQSTMPTLSLSLSL